MKVGIVIERLDPRRGGVEQWTYQFVRRLTLEHEVHVVARAFAPEMLRLGLIAHTIEAGANRLDFAQRAEYKLRALPLDVIHDTGCGWHCDVFQPHGGSRRASFEQNLRLAPSWLRPWKRRVAQWLPRYQEFQRLQARQFHAPDRLFLALSHMVAEDLQRFHGVAPAQRRIVYNGVDVERFSPRQRLVYRDALRAELGIEPGEVLCLIVAHNFALKGVPTLVAAAERLARQGEPVRVVVVGGKRPRGGSTDTSTSRPTVQFVGPIDDVVPYYAAADLYVQPTFYDPCSLVVLEALACGLPVITSRFNGAGELMTPGVEGTILDDPADVDALQQAMRDMLDEPRRRQAADAARQLALQHTLDRNCREIVAVYEEVVARRSALAA